MITNKRSIFAAALIALTLLTGCEDDKPSLSVSPTSINFTAEKTDYEATPYSATIKATVNNIGEQVYIGAFFTDNGISDMSLSPDSENSFLVYVTPKPPRSLEPGLYTDLIEIDVCSDEYCSSHIDGSPQTVKVSYLVDSTIFAVLKSSMYFTYILGSASPPADQIVTIYGDNTSWLASISDPWILLSSTSGVAQEDLSVNIDLSKLGPGSYQGTLNILNKDVPTDSFSVDIHASITMPTIVLSAYSLQFTNVAGIPSDVQTIMMNWDNQDTAPINVSTSDNWILIDQTQPDGGISVQVDPQGAGLAVGQYTGAITFSGVSGGYAYEKVLNVNLNYRAPYFLATANRLNFQGVEKSAIPSQFISISIENGDTAPISYNADVSWLVLDSTTTPDGVTVSIDTQDPTLTLGTNVGQIALSATSYGVPVVGYIPVYVNILAAAPAVTSNSPQMFNAPNSAPVTTQIATLRGNQNGNIVQDVTATSNWLVVNNTPNTGSDSSIAKQLKTSIGGVPPNQTNTTSKIVPIELSRPATLIDAKAVKLVK